MNVFVETNFVLELALDQEQHESCVRLLGLAEEGRIRLFVPAYSIIEAYETMARRHRDRKKLRSDLDGELSQLGRSSSLADRVTASQEVLNLLMDSADRETRQIEDVRSRLCAVAEILPCDRDTLELATEYQTEHDFSPQDAVVYASIRRYLTSNKTDESVFVSKNSRDFDDPDLETELAFLNCKYLPRFDAAVRYITRPERESDDPRS